MAETSLPAHPHFGRTLTALSASHQQQHGKVVVNGHAIELSFPDNLQIGANLNRFAKYGGPAAVMMAS
jgi:hypothetical protein